MEEKLKELYENIHYISLWCMDHKQNDYIDKCIQNVFEPIQKFVEWFMDGNQFGIDDMLYQELQTNLLSILQDMEEAVKQKDRVLLMDALEYGIREYLAMFLPEEYLEQQKEKI